MEQKQMMMLLAVIVVVVIVVAAVMLMQPAAPPVAPPAPGGQEQPAAPSEPTGPSQPSAPTQPTTPTTSGDMAAVADAIAGGAPVMCQMNLASDGMEMPATIWIEGMKMRMEAKVEQEGISMDLIVLSDGVNIYTNMFGEWYSMPIDQENAVAPTPEEIRASVEDMPDIETNCQVLADIPDSQFQLPAGVVPKDMAQMMEDMMAQYGAGM